MRSFPVTETLMLFTSISFSSKNLLTDASAFATVAAEKIFARFFDEYFEKPEDERMIFGRHE